MHMAAGASDPSPSIRKRARPAPSASERRPARRESLAGAACETLPWSA